MPSELQRLSIEYLNFPSLIYFHFYPNQSWIPHEQENKTLKKPAWQQISAFSLARLEPPCAQKETEMRWCERERRDQQVWHPEVAARNLGGRRNITPGTFFPIFLIRWCGEAAFGVRFTNTSNKIFNQSLYSLFIHSELIVDSLSFSTSAPLVFLPQLSDPPTSSQRRPLSPAPSLLLLDLLRSDNWSPVGGVKGGDGRSDSEWGTVNAPGYWHIFWKQGRERG